MATFVPFYEFTKDLGEEIHNFGSDQLVVVLTAAANAPVQTNTVLADLTQISYTDCSSRNVTTTSWTQATGTAKLVLADLTLTSSGTVGPFRYVIVYNDTAASDNLICYYDYGSEITVNSGETLLIDFDGTNGVFTLAPA